MSMLDLSISLLLTDNKPITFSPVNCLSITLRFVKSTSIVFKKTATVFFVVVFCGGGVAFFSFFFLFLLLGNSFTFS